MIASDSLPASEAGAQMYTSGGNVVDAAIAISLALCVIRPQSTGLGGGGFLLLHLNGKTLAFDFRERAPRLAHRDMYLKSTHSSSTSPSLIGYRSIAVPGMIAGLTKIHSLYGTLPFSKIAAPAISLAENGFRVYPDLSRATQKAWKDMTHGMQSIFFFFFSSDGSLQPLQTGDILIQKDLAKSLRLISQKGKNPFYTGKVAQLMALWMKQKGGLITRGDLNSYRVFLSKPLTAKYHDRKIVTMPLPSSGTFLLTMLNSLASQPLAKLYKDQKEKYYHSLAQAMKQGYEERSQKGGDPRFIKQNSPEKTSLNQSKKESQETTHFSIIDRNGNAVSSTQSINYSFGSRTILPGWGIVMNDTMDDFSISPGVPNAYGLTGSEANSIYGGKTPLSSMTPVFVMDQENSPILALGAPGGSHIISSVLQALVHDIDLGMNPLISVATKRIHYQYNPDILFAEPKIFSPSTQKELINLGYHIQFQPLWAKVFLVKRVKNQQGSFVFMGVSDPRGNGSPYGTSLPLPIPNE